MVRSLASKLSPHSVTGPIDQISRRIKLGPLGSLREVPFNVKVLAEAGVLRPVRPDKLAAMAVLLSRWGASPAAGIAGAAVNHPDEPMIEDELGTLTFAEVQLRSNAIARGLAERRRRRGRRRRDHVPQPPWLHRDDARGLQARRQRAST